MSEWMQLASALIGSTTLMGGLVCGIGWWFKTRRDDRIKRELAQAEREKEILKESKEAQQEVKAMLQDRIKYEMVRGDSSALTGKVLNELAARQGEFMQMIPAALERQRQMLEALERLSERLHAIERALSGKSSL